MKELLKLLPILLIFSCAGDNNVQLKDYYELREDNFLIPGFTVDLEEIVERSKLTGKPILFYFNGLGCVNCRKMEERILGNKKTTKIIVKNFLLVPLAMDDRTAIPEEERRKSKLTGKMMRTAGSVNCYLQYEVAYAGSQPHFVVMNADKEIMGEMVYTSNKRTFLQFLESSIEKYHASD